MAEGRAFAGFSERGNTILRAMHQPNFCTSKTEQHRSQIHLQSQKTQQILVASKISNGDLDNDRPYDSDQRSSDQDRSQISLLPPGSLGDAVAFSVFPSEREDLRTYSNEHGKRLLPLPVFKSDSPDGRVLEEPRDSDIDVRGRYSSHGTATSHRAPSRNRAQRPRSTRLADQPSEVSVDSELETAPPWFHRIKSSTTSSVPREEEKKRNSTRALQAVEETDEPSSSCVKSRRSRNLDESSDQGSGTLHSVAAPLDWRPRSRLSRPTKRLRGGRSSSSEPDHSDEDTETPESTANNRDQNRRSWKEAHGLRPLAQQHPCCPRTEPLQQRPHQPSRVASSRRSTEEVQDPPDASSSGQNKVGQQRSSFLRTQRDRKKPRTRQDGSRTRRICQEDGHRAHSRVHRRQRKSFGRSALQVQHAKALCFGTEQTRPDGGLLSEPSLVLDVDDFQSDGGQRNGKSLTRDTELAECTLVPRSPLPSKESNETPIVRAEQPPFGTPSQRRTASLAKFIRDRLQISEENRKFLYPDCTITRLGLVFEALTAQFDTDDICELTEEQRLTFFRTQLTGLRRPQTKRDQLERLFNLFRELDDPNFDHKQKMGRNMVHSLTDLPRRKPKILINLDGLMSWWRARLPATSWIQTRNDAILFYVLTTGRRAANAAKALMPESRVDDLALLLDELKPKRDERGRGRRVLIWQSTDAHVCPVRVIQKYLDHPTTTALADNWTDTKENCPLFFASDTPTPQALSKDRARNIITEALKSAGCLTDNLGRRLTQKALRGTQWTRALAAGAPTEFVRVMQARKPAKPETQAYFCDSSYRDFTDLMVGVKKTCTFGTLDLVDINKAEEIRKSSMEIRRSPRLASTSSKSLGN